MLGTAHGPDAEGRHRGIARQRGIAAVHRNLEPRLHGVQRESRRHVLPAPGEERRHRHGLRARREHHSVHEELHRFLRRDFQLRDGRLFPDFPRNRKALREKILLHAARRGNAGRDGTGKNRRRLPRHRRPYPHAFVRRRRRHRAGQQRPQLRAAAHPAARRAPRPHARLPRTLLLQARRRARRHDGRRVPGNPFPPRGRARDHPRRGRGLQQDAGRRARHLRGNHRAEERGERVARRHRRHDAPFRRGRKRRERRARENRRQHGRRHRPLHREIRQAREHGPRAPHLHALRHEGALHDGARRDRRARKRGRARQFPRHARQLPRRELRTRRRLQRRGRLPALRHLRLPVRPHRAHGAGTRLFDGRKNFRRADGGAAGTRPRRPEKADRLAFRNPHEGGDPFPRLRNAFRRSDGARNRRQQGQARRRARPHALLRRNGRAGRRRGNARRARPRLENPRHAQKRERLPAFHRGQRAAARRRQSLRLRRRKAPPRDRTQPHRDAPAALRAAQRRRERRRAERLLRFRRKADLRLQFRRARAGAGFRSRAEGQRAHSRRQPHFLDGNSP